MPARPALSAAPANALLTWTDGRDLYIELSSPSGPVPIRYPLTASGLSAALGIIQTRARFDGRDLSAIPPPPPGNHATSAQYDNARARLRQLGLIR